MKALLFSVMSGSAAVLATAGDPSTNIWATGTALGALIAALGWILTRTIPSLLKVQQEQGTALLKVNQEQGTAFTAGMVAISEANQKMLDRVSTQSHEDSVQTQGVLRELASGCAETRTMLRPGQ